MLVTTVTTKLSVLPFVTSQSSLFCYRRCDYLNWAPLVLMSAQRHSPESVIFFTSQPSESWALTSRGPWSHLSPVSEACYPTYHLQSCRRIWLLLLFLKNQKTIKVKRSIWILAVCVFLCLYISPILCSPLKATGSDSPCIISFSDSHS